MQTLKVSLFQQDIIWENPIENKKRIEEFIKNLQTDILVLPEMFTTGFSMEVEKLAEVTEGETLNWMKTISKQLNCLLIGSFIVHEKNNYYNRLFCVYPDGNYQSYDKRHLFRMAKEHKYFASGSEKFIIEWRNWKLLPLICYDLRFPIWSRNNLKKEELSYDLGIYIANWPDKRIHHWKRLLQARAIENQSYVLGVNRVGEGNEIQYNGNSIVCDFHGDILNSIQENIEEIISVHLDKEVLGVYRRAFPAYLDADDFEFI